MAQGFRHEAQFDPLAALFEGLENFELVHFHPRKTRLTAKRKGAAHGPRLSFLKVLLYISIISQIEGGMGHLWEIICSMA